MRPPISKDAPEGLVALRLDEDRVLFAYPLAGPRLAASLTEGERHVVLLALDGLDNAEIARVRGTAARTVANLLARAFRKLGVRSRSELAALLFAPKK
jgi:DNA-binding CsgD family transcriptional regulator